MTHEDVGSNGSARNGLCRFVGCMRDFAPAQRRFARRTVAELLVPVPRPT